jgi:hypothetical protein
MWLALEHLRQPRQPPLPHNGRLVENPPEVELRPKVLAHEQPVHHQHRSSDIAAAGRGNLVSSTQS